ncbi:hypothetical protein HGA91_03545 [candidate division WWE3 bacterium]|nr:hypothetical protein [candidate division WWE3 bacterium]
MDGIFPNATIRRGKNGAPFGQLYVIGQESIDVGVTIVRFLAYIAPDPIVDPFKYWHQALTDAFGSDAHITSSVVPLPDGNAYSVVFRLVYRGAIRSETGLVRAVAGKYARCLIEARLDAQPEGDDDDLESFEESLVVSHLRHVAQGDDSFQAGGEMGFYAHGF